MWWMPDMTMLSKEAILSAHDIRTEDVAIPEWGGNVRIAVMSGLARDKFVELQGDGKSAFSEFQARLLVSTVVDGSGLPLFADADIEALRGKSKAVLDRLMAVAMRINSLGPDAAEEAEKNSDAALSGASGSSSPSI